MLYWVGKEGSSFYISNWWSRRESGSRPLYYIYHRQGVEERLLMEHDSKLDKTIQWFRRLGQNNNQWSILKIWIVPFKPKVSFPLEPEGGSGTTISKPNNDNTKPFNAYCS